MLEEMGDVVRIRNPYKEADPIYRIATRHRKICRLLCFCQPNQAPINLECPTTVILAWEFDSIPTDPWNGDQRNDWRTVLAAHGQVITLSKYGLKAVRAAIGPDFPVTAIPMPVYDHVQHDELLVGRYPPNNDIIVRFDGELIDSRQLSIIAEHVILREVISSRLYDGSLMEIRFSKADEGSSYLLGFHLPEDWGVWSQSSTPSIILPFALGGRVGFRLCVCGYGVNIGHSITITVGNCSHTVILSAEPSEHFFTLEIESPSNQIIFSGLSPCCPGVEDTRTIALGFIHMEVTGNNYFSGETSLVRPNLNMSSPHRSLFINGVVYTTVFNPSDGRKNWEDIVKAFCYALRDKEDATLVLKCTTTSSIPFLVDLLSMIRIIGNIRCRIVAVNAYLDRQEYQALMDGTTYYVNASRGEGLCIPLMEFMSRGVPSIAPFNTAMTDYISQESSFVVSSSIQPAAWPNDPSKRLRTLNYRINWESLAGAFRESYRVAHIDKYKYQTMSLAASRGLANVSSNSAVTYRLYEHLNKIAS